MTMCEPCKGKNRGCETVGLACCHCVCGCGKISLIYHTPMTRAEFEEKVAGSAEPDLGIDDMVALWVANQERKAAGKPPLKPKDVVDFMFWVPLTGKYLQVSNGVVEEVEWEHEAKG